MCGIVGFTGRENALPILIKGLYSLEYRGYDSAGVAAFTKDGLRVVKARGRIANLEEKIKEEGGDMILHLRYRPHPLGNARRAVRPQLASASGRQGQGSSRTQRHYRELQGAA